MKIKEVMKKAQTIDINSSARQAASLMDKYHIGSLVVTNGEKVLGILTEKDLLSKVTAKNKLPSKVKVKEIVSKYLITLEPDSPIDDAAYLMIKHKIKRIPIMKDEKLLGILTATDVVAHSDEMGQFYIFD